MSNDNTNFVWAVFDNEDAAKEAAKSLKDWDKDNKNIKLDSVGVVHMSDKGKLKVKKMGPRHTGKGAMIGAILGGLVALFAPATLIGGAIAGGLAGGVLGVFSKKGLGLSDEQEDSIKAGLDGGKGLVIALADDGEVDATTAKLVELGGETDSTKVDEDAISDTDAAMADADVKADVETE